MKSMQPVCGIIQAKLNLSYELPLDLRKTGAYTIDERTALRVASGLLNSILEDGATNTPKKSLRFLVEQLSYLDGRAASQMTFSPALIRLCSTLRGLGPDCYDVLVWLGIMCKIKKCRISSSIMRFAGRRTRAEPASSALFPSARGAHELGDQAANQGEGRGGSIR